VSETLNKDRQQDIEQLNAFVDGELDIEARAEVTARASKDPAYARELAALSRLKATLGESVPVPDIAVPAQPARHGFGWTAKAIAASLLLVFTAGIGWIAYDNRPAPAPQISLDWLIKAHRAWSPRPPVNPGTVPARLTAAALHPTVPDLSTNGLDIAYAGEWKAPDGEKALVTGYLGSRGCRLTLLVHRSEKAPLANPVTLETGSLRASLWQAGLLRYALVAEGMASNRFRLIADTVRRATFERLPFDRKTRSALAQNRAASPPCRA